MLAWIGRRDRIECAKKITQRFIDVGGDQPIIIWKKSALRAFEDNWLGRTRSEHLYRLRTRIQDELTRQGYRVTIRVEPSFDADGRLNEIAVKIDDNSNLASR